MTIAITQQKTHKTVNCISNILSKNSPSIREVAQVIGYMVSSFPAVKYSKCHYSALENDNIEALKASKGNFDYPMCLSTSGLADIKWLLANLPTSHGFVQPPPISCTLSSDASQKGERGVRWEALPLGAMATTWRATTYKCFRALCCVLYIKVLFTWPGWETCKNFSW